MFFCSHGLKLLAHPGLCFSMSSEATVKTKETNFEKMIAEAAAVEAEAWLDELAVAAKSELAEGEQAEELPEVKEEEADQELTNAEEELVDVNVENDELIDVKVEYVELTEAKAKEEYVEPPAKVQRRMDPSLMVGVPPPSLPAKAGPKVLAAIWKAASSSGASSPGAFSSWAADAPPLQAPPSRPPNASEARSLADTAVRKCTDQLCTMLADETQGSSCEGQLVS